MQRMQRDGMEPQLPELQAGGHLVGYLFEAGPTSPAGMGSAPLAWAELQAWQAQVGIELESWEVRTLRRLSGDFVAESRRAEAPDAASPLAVQTTERNRSSVARRVALEFGAMAAAQRTRNRQ